MKTVFTLFIFLAVPHIFAVNTYSQKKKVEASFCNLSLSETTKLANTNFTNRYFFRIGSDNKPIKINRISGYDFINDEEVKSCIDKWVFKNFVDSTSFVVEISWEHMYGWQPMRIKSKDYSKTVKSKTKGITILSKNDFFGSLFY